MLTSDLLRVRVKGKELHPTFLRTDRADLLKAAGAMVGTVEQAEQEGWTRGELSEQLSAPIRGHRSQKALKGLKKLLEDRCEFETKTPIPPSDLRKLVFERSAARGPLALEPNVLGHPTADDIFAEIAEELNTSPQSVRDSLYADLPAAQRVTSARPYTPEGLLHRYNVALVQGILLRSTRLHLQLHAPRPHRVRQLFRHLKFCQLMHHSRREEDILHLTLDGPTSLFKQSTKYGMQLANFFPALLLQECNWTLDAEVLWTKAKVRKSFSLTFEAGLKSHYQDTGAWVSREHQWFRERWDKLAPKGWTISEDTTPIELGGHGVILPDFVFSNGERTAQLEMIGYWRRDYLRRRIEGLRDYAPGNLILAVSDKLIADGTVPEDCPAHVIRYKSVLPPKTVLKLVDVVAS